MVLLVAAGILVVASFIVLFALRRRGTERLHSVDGYRRTLTTLQDVRSRSLTGGSVRIIGPPGSATDTERTARTLDPPNPAGTGRAPPDYPGYAARPPARSLRAGQRRRERAIAQMSRRPKRVGGPLAAAAVVVVVVTGLAVAGAHGRHPGPKTTSTTTKTGKHTATSGRHRGHATAATTTTTTFPSSFGVSGTTSSTATYSVPNPDYTLNFTATTGASWIEVTNSAGATLVAETLPAGQHQAIPLSGDAKVILGAPGYLQVKVNSSPVVLPGGISELLFDVPTPPAPTTSTTTPGT